jgi:hypothetical protein
MPRLTAAVLGEPTTSQPCLAEAPGAVAVHSSAPAEGLSLSQHLGEALPPPVPKHLLSEERLYRHADGRLSPTRPPPEPYTVAARRDWHDLVTYTRMHGGCAECTQGTCFRHGTGVSFEAMYEYLEQLGVPVESDAFGWHGLDGSKPLNPLDDPAHPLYEPVL